MNQSNKVASLTTARLSPLAKPFTLNRSTHQPSSNSSVLSTQQSCVHSLDHCDDDPFSSLLDSFKKSNLGSKGDTVVPVPLSDHAFGQDTVTRTLCAEAAIRTLEKPLFEQHPSLDFPKNGELDGLRWSHFEVLPTFPPNATGVDLRKSNGNEVSHGKQEVDFHETLFGKGNDVGSSVDSGGMLQKGKHAVDGLNSCPAMSDGTFKKSAGTIVTKDILSYSKGTTHAVDESSSFLMSNCSIAPVNLSTTDMSSAAKLTSTPQSQSSNNLADSDSDVDSPCWKGTNAFCVTSSENSDSVQFNHVEKATEKHNSLNPLAPQFFPGIGYVKDDFAPSNYKAPAAINLLSGEDVLMKTVAAESPVELNKGIELQHSSNINGTEKAFSMLNNPKSSLADPVLNSHCIMSQSSSCSTSKGKQVTVLDVDGFVKVTKYPRASGSPSGVFPARGHSPTPTTSSSRVGCVPDLCEKLEGFSKSLIESPKPDVQTMVSAMHVLSELLVQTCVDGVDSYNEHDPVMIQQIINNLNVLSTKKIGQRIPTINSTPAYSPCCTDRSSELPNGLEVARIETQTVPHQLHVKNDYMGKNSVSKVFAGRGLVSFASSSHQGTENGNELTQLQVIRRSLGNSLDFEKQMHPETLLFWNLWLDSEAERCYRRYKTYRSLLEAGIDVNCANFAELWG